MPAADGTLNPEELKNAISRLEELWGKRKVCPICTNTDWGIDSRLGKIPAFGTPLGPRGEQYVFPMLILHCTRCFYTVMFNAARMQLVAGEPYESLAKPQITKERGNG